MIKVCAVLILGFVATGCATPVFTDRETECEERGYERGTYEHTRCVARERS